MAAQAAAARPYPLFVTTVHPVSPEVPALPAEESSSAAECRPRERTTAFIAMVVAFILAMSVVLVAILVREDGGVGFGSGTRGVGLGAGVGTGDGTGVGAGSGPGGGATGDGPGAGAAGLERGLRGEESGDAPPGVRAGTDPAAMPAEQPAEATQEPPKWGFTRPDDPPRKLTPPVVAQPPGTPDGKSGSGKSGAGGGGSEFMGVKSSARHVVYVIDMSGSMEGMRLAHTKLELVRSIEQLPEDASFSIVFFDDQFEVMPPQRMVPASKRWKADAIDWLRHQQARGGTDPTAALEFALSLRPQAIFLMTDGMFQNPSLVNQMIDRMNTDRRTSINTIAFHERGAEQELQKIAAENRGDYRYVPPPTQ